MFECFNPFLESIGFITESFTTSIDSFGLFRVNFKCLRLKLRMIQLFKLGEQIKKVHKHVPELKPLSVIIQLILLLQSL